jgi:hypothetical protein
LRKRGNANYQEHREQSERRSAFDGLVSS